MIDTKVRVINKAGNDVAKNGTEVGEIIVKGNGVLQDRIHDRTTADGWLYTGDMGTVDEKGRVYVVDSKKDIFITNGENISSVQVEMAINEHPAVQEVSVIAAPHESWGEVAQAFVVRHANKSITEQDLIDFTRKKLEHSNHPIEISFMEELPRTASGKILKTQLGTFTQTE